ncbi:MAG: hypothetical protein F6K19_13355 [Cyanothece sp. SIO1E1]|nr:hypothetical protein [Cyanothece sp. SIO1E1]
MTIPVLMTKHASDDVSVAFGSKSTKLGGQPQYLKSQPIDPLRVAKDVCLLEPRKSCYQADHQAKFSALWAEADALLLELKNLQEQRLAALNPPPD